MRLDSPLESGGGDAPTAATHPWGSQSILSFPRWSGEVARAAAAVVLIERAIRASRFGQLVHEEPANPSYCRHIGVHSLTFGLFVLNRTAGILTFIASASADFIEQFNVFIILGFWLLWSV